MAIDASTHTFIKPTVIARRALAVLYNSMIFAPLVFRDYDDEFNGQVGDTISIRTPTTFVANDYVRSSGISVQTAVETSFPVVLDKIIDVSFEVTAEDMTLRVEDFDEQFMQPAMMAIAQRVDGMIAEKLVDIAEGGGGGGTVTMGASAKPTDTIRKARVALSRAKAPFSERYAVFGPETSGEFIGQDLILQVNTSGSTQALREGGIGRLMGFDTYESNVLGYGTSTDGSDAGQADGIAFHKSALAFVSRTLALPMGVAPNQAAVANYNGLGIRVVKAYDINKKKDIISLDFLCGLTAIRKNMAVQLNLGLGS